VLATGRSDYPNEVNNVLAFPGVFRGLLDARARGVSAEVELAAAKALAATVPPQLRSAEYILPSVFDRDVVPAVAKAVAAATRAMPRAEPLPVPPRALLSVFGAYTFVPGHWNQDEYGVPTSYYAAVQLACDAEIIDEPGQIAAVLERQLAHFQPEGKHAPVEPGDNAYGKLLGSIRG